MRQTILQQISISALKFLVPLTTEETYKIIVSEAEKIIGADFGTIFLQEQGELRRVYADAAFFSRLKPRPRGFTYDTFTKNQPKLIDVRKEKNFHPAIKKRGIKSIVYVPLSYKDKTIGVLIVHSKKHKTVSKNDFYFYTLFGALASMAIRKMQLYDETREALATRDLFISLASHELRTPLTSINGYIHLLSSKLKDNKGSEGKWINELTAESKRLTSLITELLEINRIKQGQLQYEFRECGLKEFLDIAIDRYRFVNPEREIEYVQDPRVDKAKIIGDSNKLLQMTTALLSNADKFSRRDLPITLKVKLTAKHVVILVIDHGAGIPDAHLAHIFEGFYKGENGESQGLGVGLLLAKHIISSHHGIITVKSKKKKGTTVQVKLPRIT
ncbi:MAG: GAF domain-containing sensor histidine kinase [Patescibacteria group bacterium]